MQQEWKEDDLCALAVATVAMVAMMTITTKAPCDCARLHGLNQT
jgi:hypothetical protein